MCASDEISASNLAPGARKTVAAVAGLNGFGAIVEVTIAIAIGSVALFADAADFLEDTLSNLLVLTALGWSVASRRKASYALAGIILLPAIAAFGAAIYKVLSQQPPEPLALTATSVFALVINLVAALLLMRLRSGNGALLRGAWLAARNDMLANVLMIIAGVVTLFWFSIWPDAVVGVLMGIINIRAAREVFEQARAEDPELEMD